MRRVLIGTPAHTGTVDVWFAHSLAQTVRLGIASGVDFRELFRSYDSLVQRARNDLVKDALENGFDDLIFIDGDQAWHPEGAMALLGHHVDCVGAAVPKKTDVETYNVNTDGQFPVLQANGLMNVKRLGTGFLRLSRRALSALWETSQPYECDGRTGRMIFNVHVVDGRLMSEDNVMCDKLRAAGIEVWLDPAIACTHIGIKRYGGDFAAWLAKLRADDAFEGVAN